MVTDHISGIRHKRKKDNNAFGVCVLFVSSETDMKPPALQTNTHRDNFVYSLQKKKLFTFVTHDPLPCENTFESKTLRKLFLLKKCEGKNLKIHLLRKCIDYISTSHQGMLGLSTK
jgi:hypothetical protein